MRRYVNAVPLAALLTWPVIVMAANAGETYDSASWQKAYGLRHIQLGMTLDDFRLVKLGGTNIKGEPTNDLIVCDRDDIATTSLAFSSVQERGIRDVGVTKCAFYYGTGFSRESFYPTSMGFGQKFAGEYKSEYETGFYFIRPEGAEHAYLFRIEADLDPDVYYKARDGIAKKYGSPKLAKKTVQNGFGAMFHNEVASWNNGASSIKVEKYDFDLGHGKVVYELKQLAAIHSQRRSAVSPHITPNTEY